ncbi:NEDD4-binding protein 2 [Lepisosteus oculatus]|uniref:NEDD4-binding protein 2 n=1 Tax=Lepisosteus oculatus TaxID=7918 RepID=UPI0035F51B55
MPRKKKSAQSPARVPNPSAGEGGSVTGKDGAMSRRFGTEPPSSSSGREEILNRMREMFWHLDPEVIYIVLSECDFQAEAAMDSLLMLSTAAEGASPACCPLGFESTTALLPPGPPAGAHASRAVETSPPTVATAAASQASLRDLDAIGTHLTEDFDELIDSEFRALAKEPFDGAVQPAEDSGVSSEHPGPIMSGTASRSTPEWQQDRGKGPKQQELVPSCSPASGLSLTGAGYCPGETTFLDFSHLALEPESSRQAALDLGDSGRPSAFQAYKSSRPPRAPPAGGGEGSSPNGSELGEAEQGTGHGSETRAADRSLRSPAAPVIWNTQAPEFQPRSRAPAFVTPLAADPGHWRPGSDPGAGGRAPPFRPPAPIPASRALPAPPRPPLHGSGKIPVLVGRVLVLLRGAPGSGKSTLARNLLEQNPGGVVLSTDDYFCRNGGYRFNSSSLEKAHEWNHRQAKETFEKGVSPIIIDNTNMQGWEMKPYVAMALRYKYRVMFREPDNWWKTKPRELERRTKHGVKKEKIKWMLEHYERYVTVQTIMGSEPPSGEEERNSVPLSQEETSVPEAAKVEAGPDLVEERHSEQSSGESDLQPLPRPEASAAGEGAAQEEGLCQREPAHSLGPQARARMEDPMGPDLRSPGPIDASASGAEAAVSSAGGGGSQAVGNKRAETGWGAGVVEWDAREPPTAFFESIRQRVRRKRGSRQGGRNGDVSGGGDAAEGTRGSERGNGLAGTPDRQGVRPELLSFVGDWPSGPVLEQRRRRPKKASATQESSDESDSSRERGGEGKELLDLLDLLRAGPDGTRNPHTLSPGSPDLETFAQNSHSESLSLETSPHPEEPGGDAVLDVGATNSVYTQPVADTRPELLDSAADWLTSAPLVEQSGKSPITREQARVELWAPGESNTGTTDEKEGQTDVASGETEETGSSVDCHSEISCQNQTAPPGASKCLPADSQDRKSTESGRGGKMCRLAPTFPNNCPASPESSKDSPRATPFDSAAPDSTASISTQTMPHDFTLLWKANKHGLDVSGLVVFQGNSTNFQPKPAVSLESQEVPYRVVHDKGTQVEETELSTEDKLKNLQILSEHFKLVSFDVLKDLYEKCNQDMEWTTNLLLDSGEQLFKEDEILCPDQVRRQPELWSVGGSDSDAWPCAQWDESSVQSVPGDQHSRTPAEVTSSDVGDAKDEGSPGLASSLELLDEGCHGERGWQQVVEGCPSELPTEAVEHSVGQSTAEPSDREQPPELKPTEGGGEREDKSKTQNPSELDEILDLHENLGAGLGALDEAEGCGAVPEEWAEAGALLAPPSSVPAPEVRKEHSPAKQPPERTQQALDIETLELRLPAELAFQLSDLFGSVGIDPGALSLEDCVVQIDLNLAKLLHQKWKDTIQERQRQAALSYQLLEESAGLWIDSQTDRLRRTGWSPVFPGAAGQSEPPDSVLFMDHWSTPMPHVSLRDIMLEEQALQEHLEKSKLNRDLDRKNGAALLKEQELYKMFPTIDRHFLLDIFRDNNYSLEQTEQFLKSVLDEGPVKTVVAQDVAQRVETQRPLVKEKKKVARETEAAGLFQDTEDPDYADFRAEAILQHRKQQECFSKAAEAYRQGMKDVATFYAQQGHLHGQRMKEAHRRAALRIFERVNSSLLPQNVLDLHGLHVDEALRHLKIVLEDKMAECQRSGGKPHLSVITGRGNRSQGGVARIKPAVIDYLTHHDFRFTEPKPGLLLISLR